MITFPKLPTFFLPLALALLPMGGCIANTIDDADTGADVPASTGAPTTGACDGSEDGGTHENPDPSTTTASTTATPTTTASTGPITTANGETTYAESGADDDGPLLTTGNDSAIEWDVTVRYTHEGDGPHEGTYRITTLNDMVDMEFEAVVEIPGAGASTSYGYIVGDAFDGAVTITDGSVKSFNVGIDGTLTVSETMLSGSGSLFDLTTDELQGTWEILGAAPL